MAENGRPTEATPEINAAIDDLLDEVGVSQAELARRMGVSQPTVQRWREGPTPERPNVGPALAKIPQIEEALRPEGVQPGEIMRRAGWQPRIMSPIDVILTFDVLPIKVRERIAGELMDEIEKAKGSKVRKQGRVRRSRRAS